MSSGEGERKSERARERESLGAWESGRRRDEERYFFLPLSRSPFPTPAHLNGIGLTTASGMTFWTPSATTLSPGFSPLTPVRTSGNRHILICDLNNARVEEMGLLLHSLRATKSYGRFALTA